LPKRIAELAAERPRFGYRRLTALLKREGVSVWHGPGASDDEGTAVASATAETKAIYVLEAQCHRDYATE
jgi:hypothetical protein